MNTIGIVILLIICFITVPTIIYFIEKYSKHKYFKQEKTDKLVSNNRSNNTVRFQKIKFDDNYMDIVNRWLNDEIDYKQAAEELHISKSSLYNYFGHLKRKSK